MVAKKAAVKDEQKAEIATTPAPAAYHVMVRYLSSVNVPDRNMFTAETVKSHIQTWVDLGYKIHTSQHISTVRDEESGVSAEGVYFLFEYVG